jgi:hypothetical protein
MTQNSALKMFNKAYKRSRGENMELYIKKKSFNIDLSFKYLIKSKFIGMD